MPRTKEQTRTAANYELDEDKKPAREEKDESQETDIVEVKHDDDGNVDVEIPVPSRRDRRAKRYEDLHAERDQLRGEMDEMRRSQGAMQNYIGQMQAEIAVARSQSKPNGAEDPYKKQLADIRREQENIQATLRGGNVSSVEDVDKLKQRFYDLEDGRLELSEKRLEERVLAKAREKDPADRDAGILEGEFPEVVANPQAMRYALGQYHLMTAEGKPQTIATSREAMRKSAEKFGMIPDGGPPPPSRNQQARYGAVNSQAGARGQGEVTRLTPAQMRMAVVMYPKMDEDKAYATWAKMFHASQKGEENKS